MLLPYLACEDGSKRLRQHVLGDAEMYRARYNKLAASWGQSLSTLASAKLNSVRLDAEWYERQLGMPEVVEEGHCCEWVDIGDGARRCRMCGLVDLVMGRQ